MIRSDGSGLITQIDYEAGDRSTAAGTMLSYVTQDACSITIDVSEEDISHISVGDTVTIEMTAYRTRSGRERSAPSPPRRTANTPPTVNYPVTIHVEGDTSRIYGGMTADITFVTDSVENVLYVGCRRCRFRRGRQHLRLCEGRGGKHVLQPVVTGFPTAHRRRFWKDFPKATRYISPVRSARESMKKA